MARRRKQGRRRVKKSLPRKGTKKSAFSISQKKGRDKYTISFERKSRSERETKNLIDNINYDKLIKAYPDTKFVHITIYAKYQKKTVARTYIAQTHEFDKEGINQFLNEFVEEIFSHKLDYGVKKSVKWKNYIQDIVFNEFKQSKY